MERIDSLLNKIDVTVNKKEYSEVKTKPEAGKETFKSEDISEKTNTKSTENSISELVEPIKEFFNSNATNVKFGVFNSEKNSEIAFKVLDAKTGEVIREFPEEEITKLYESTRSSNGLGILVDSDA